MRFVAGGIMAQKTILCRGEGRSFPESEFEADKKGRLVHKESVMPHYTTGALINVPSLPDLQTVRARLEQIADDFGLADKSVFVDQVMGALRKE
jgi:hypothetical protein